MLSCDTNEKGHATLIETWNFYNSVKIFFNWIFKNLFEIIYVFFLALDVKIFFSTIKQEI